MALITTLARRERVSLQAASAPSSCENRTGRISLIITLPLLGFSTRMSVCALGRPAGITSLPAAFSCWISGGNQVGRRRYDHFVERR